MEENKNQLENTDHGMKENSVAPETPFHESEPGERGSREDTSYSYGEYRREGAPYQAQDHGSQGEWDSTPLTMGDWLLTLLAAFIPCCGGIILYCYWAFAKQGNLHRRNFCRAALIIEAVLVVLLIVFLILVVMIQAFLTERHPEDIITDIKMIKVKRRSGLSKQHRRFRLSAAGVERTVAVPRRMC